MCPECQNKYFMSIGSINGVEFYRCHKCWCVWKWQYGIKSITKESEINELLKGEKVIVGRLDF